VISETDFGWDDLLGICSFSQIQV